MKVVTADSRPDGIAASSSQRSRRGQSIAAGAGAAEVAACGDRGESTGACASPARERRPA